MGNRLPDREGRVDEFFFRAAELCPEVRFALGGEGWGDKPMPGNVEYLGHVPTARHNEVNANARLVLNIHRDSMVRNGWSPATRMFEAAGAAACQVTDAGRGSRTSSAPGRRSCSRRTPRRWRGWYTGPTRRRRGGSAKRLAAGRSTPTPTRSAPRGWTRSCAHRRAPPREVPREAGRLRALALVELGERARHHLSGPAAYLRGPRSRDHLLGVGRPLVPGRAPRPSGPGLLPAGALRQLGRGRAPGTRRGARGRRRAGRLLRARGDADHRRPRRRRSRSALLLRHRHPDHGGAIARRGSGVPSAGPGGRVHPLPFLHRRPLSARGARGGAGRARGAAALLRGGRGALLPGGARPGAARVARLHGHLRARPAARRGAVPDGARPPPPRPRLRGGGAPVPGGDPLAGERPPP
jgi:hypothetical protein